MSGGPSPVRGRRVRPDGSGGRGRGRGLRGSLRRGWSGLPTRIGGIGALLVLLFASGGCGHHQGAKLFVVGLDGATWDLLEPWIQAGDLPNIKAFRDASAWGTMNSVIPYLSPPAWTSAITGVNPGRHGIFDFQRRLPGQQVVVTETSKSRRSPPIWNMLKGTGKKVCIVNITMTDPPDAVDGVMVAGFPHLDPDAATGFAFPKELEERCKKMGYRLDRMEMKLPAGEEQATLDGIRETREKMWELVQQLYHESDYDLVWILFTGTDRVQHLFWKFDDPQNPHYNPAQAAKFGGTLRRYWMEQDKILGQLFTMVRPGTWVLVLSDHGFGPIRRELRVGNWLRTPAAGFSSAEASEIFSLDRSDAARLYVREPGRDPGGDLGPEQREALRARLSSGLKQTVDSQSGQHPVEAIFRAADVFVGKQAEKGPNLTLLPSYSYFINWGDADTGYKLPPYGDLTSTLSGWHRMNGLYMLRGQGVRTGHADPPFSLLDVVPTCLLILGQPLPEDLDGRIMSRVLQDSYLKSHPPVYRGHVGDEDRPLTPEEQKKLKNLPYIQ